MGAPDVIIKEIDLSGRVPSFPGAFGALVIEAKKGPVNTPYLISNETQLLKIFTPNERIDVGFDLGYFAALAFLQKSDKLWVVRAAKNALYGGVVLTGSSLSGTNVAISTGAADPETYAFSNATDICLIHGADPGKWNNDISVKITNYRASEVVGTVDITGNTLAVAQIWPTNAQVVLSGAALPTPLVSGTVYFAINVTDTSIKLAASSGGAPIVLTTTGTGPITLAPAQDVVKEVDAFKLDVVKDNVVVESFICSRVEGAKDGFGRSLYIEDVLLASAYIRAVDNLASSSAVAPKEQTTALSLLRGTDGDVVTSGTMILASDTLKNSNSVPMTILMDSGHTTPAYQQALIAIAEYRKDCVAILSTPYANESTANYLNDIIDYRKNILNANTSYAALYTPSVKAYDKFNDRSLYVSPDGYVGAAISATAMNYEIWYPVGGFKRGILNILDVRRRFEKGEMDLLYDAGINPIRFAPGKGILIWGQKTLSSRPSSLDRLNVRLMLIVIEPAIREALEQNFVFDLNTPSAQGLAKAMITSYMTGIKAKNGVQDFSVVCDSSNNTPDDIDAHIMNVHVFVKPPMSIEYIPFYVVLTRSGMDFKTAAAAI